MNRIARDANSMDSTRLRQPTMTLPRTTFSTLTTRVAMMTVLASGSLALADPPVTIEGGCDVSGHNYEWTITHQHTAPLVYIEIPHYRADTFEVPAGWEKEFINKNSPVFDPGKCIARSETGLPAGQSVTLNVRINPTGALQGSGYILLKFADGQTASVLAEVPVKETFLEAWGKAIGLGGMFVAFVAIQWWRGRGKKKNRTQESLASTMNTATGRTH
jgi:hypothetical protein